MAINDKQMSIPHVYPMFDNLPDKVASIYMYSHGYGSNSDPTIETTITKMSAFQDKKCGSYYQSNHIHIPNYFDPNFTHPAGIKLSNEKSTVNASFTGKSRQII